MNNKRFQIGQTMGGVYNIADKKDGSIVCVCFGASQRGVEKTKAMLNVMVDALNAAVEKAAQPVQEKEW